MKATNEIFTEHMLECNSYASEQLDFIITKLRKQTYLCKCARFLDNCSLLFKPNEKS